MNNYDGESTLMEVISIRTSFSNSFGSSTHQDRPSSKYICCM